MRKIHDFRFLLTIMIFVLAFVNIHTIFITVFLCYIPPFLIAYIYKKKLYCQKFCPRASFLKNFVGLFSLKLKAPRFVTHKFTRGLFVCYFIISFLVFYVSSTNVLYGRMEAMETVRFFFIVDVFQDIPQLVTFDNIPPVITHLAYRLFSMVFTTTAIGVFLGLIFKPKTWCVICPVMTITSGKAFQPKSKEVSNT